MARSPSRRFPKGPTQGSWCLQPMPERTPGVQTQGSEGRGQHRVGCGDSGMSSFQKSVRGDRPWWPGRGWLRMEEEPSWGGTALTKFRGGEPTARFRNTNSGARGSPWVLSPAQGPGTCVLLSGGDLSPQYRTQDGGAECRRRRRSGRQRRQGSGCQQPCRGGGWWWSGH